MSSKKDLGQFFTTNSDYILQGLESFVIGKKVYDPFAGGGDLLNWALKHGASSICGSDIDPNLVNDHIKLNDSLNNIPTTTFNITNPPYLGKNKMTSAQKKKYPMGGLEDLYLLSIKRILQSNPDEGIIIVPVNFFSAENSETIRVEFLQQYLISRVNYFTNQVFEDTTYNVVAFHYIRKIQPSDKQKLTIITYPAKTEKTFEIEEKYNYRIGGEELSKIIGIKPLKIIRLTENHIHKNIGKSKIKAFYTDFNSSKDYTVSPSFKKKLKENIVVISCIDTNRSEDGWIKAEDIRNYKKDCLVGKNTSRNITYLIIPDCPVEIQEKIIVKFNETFNYLRKKYDSLFLTNFRDNNRKRVGFDFCYKLISWCYLEITK